MTSPLVVDPPSGLASVPFGAAPASVLLGGTQRVFVDDAAALSLDDLWVAAASPLNADIVLTLSYDTTLSRVRITATSLDLFSAVTIQRSTDQIRWTTVRGGASVAVQSGTVRLDDYEFAPNVLNYYRLRTLAPFGQTEIASITPTLTAMWLKSVPRPFLNLTVRLLGKTFSYQRDDRGGVFPIVGRSAPVAVTEVRGSKQYTLKARTDTDQQALLLDLILASGDVLFLHAAPGSVVPTGGVFVTVTRVEVEAPNAPAPMRFTSFGVVEVAAPGPDVVGATSTWQTVLNTYATWADVIAANSTWADLVELVGNPSEVVVP